ncbi:hypothetical protein ACS8FD_00240 [Psychrobacter sp. 1U2]|uniref:hypothetical protein n=1 Tax=Psychrobacter sp. 1U2 TaxID=3453577 RepID=UPI003F4633AE
MNLTASTTASPTQFVNTIDTHIEREDDGLTSHAVSDDNGSIAADNHKNIDPSAIILAEALTDSAIAWRIHNCKVNKKTVTQDLPLPFLYHYDRLDDVIKQANPLTPHLLSQFNTPMSAIAAASLIGIDTALITSPWHVKVTGSLVVFSEALQLAVRLHWTNTGKATEQIYTKDANDALITAFDDWQFFGRIDVLYKNAKQALVSIDESATGHEQVLSFEASTDYQYLPATHALTVIAKLESDKAELPWFESAILERLA